jgi:hypothetical protein
MIMVFGIILALWTMSTLMNIILRNYTVCRELLKDQLILEKEVASANTYLDPLDYDATEDTWLLVSMTILQECLDLIHSLFRIYMPKCTAPKGN